MTIRAATSDLIRAADCNQNASGWSDSQEIACRLLAVFGKLHQCARAIPHASNRRTTRTNDNQNPTPLIKFAQDTFGNYFVFFVYPHYL